MEINTKKSKIMIVEEEEKVIAQSIQVVSKSLEAVESFKCLGSKVTADGKCLEGVRNHLAMATLSLMNLSSKW